MRTAALPPIRVEPEFRSRMESVLEEGETLSSLVKSSVRQEVTQHVTVAEFHKRGFESLTQAQVTCIYFSPEEVLSALNLALLRPKPKA